MSIKELDLGRVGDQENGQQVGRLCSRLAVCYSIRGAELLLMASSNYTLYTQHKSNINLSSWNRSLAIIVVP